VLVSAEGDAAEAEHRLPGVTRPRRFRPRFHYELLVCGLRGHELIGTDAAELRERDEIVAREIGGLRWHRCLRCDAWLPLPPPARPSRRHPPERDEIQLPLRGRPLRDKIVLRVIAIDRALHFVILALLAGAIFVLAAKRSELRAVFYRLLSDIEGTVVDQSHPAGHGLVHDAEQLLSLRSDTLRLVGAAIGALGIIELAEAVGLWYQKRWAEYLTFLVTAAFLPLEIYELSRTVSPFKVIAFVVNLAIVVYLLYAKRLFGLRGGIAAEDAARSRDVGWGSLERTSPESVGGREFTVSHRSM
jgi:uncharacterized membrane protein (DUF2068 family)